DFLIGIERFLVVLVRAAPRAQVDFIDRPGGIQGIGLRPLYHPAAVAPAVIEIMDDGSRAGPHFQPIGIRIAFLKLLPVVPADKVLIQDTRPHMGNEPYPDTRIVPAWKKRMRIMVPPVEVADHGYIGGIRRPYGKIHP